MAYIFDAATFVQQGSELDAGEWSEEDRRGITALRDLYPEISHWGDLAIGCAFGDYSEDVLAVSWAHWMLEQRDDSFLNYCCWRQTRGRWSGGIDTDGLGEANEWSTISVRTS